MGRCRGFTLWRFLGVLATAAICAMAYEFFVVGEIPAAFTAGTTLMEDLPLVDSGSKKLLKHLAFEVTSLREKSQAAQSILEVLERQAREMKEQKEALAKQEEAIQEKDETIAKLQSDLSIRNERMGRPRFGVLNHENPKGWKQRTFTHHGTFGLVKYSTYRLTRRTFATNALAALNLQEHRKLDGCTWVGRDGGTIYGKLHMLYHEEHHYQSYEVVVVVCTLEKDTGDAGGFLVDHIDNEDIVVLSEETMPVVDPPDVFPAQVTVCGPPFFGRLEAQALWEWMEYNRVMLGVDKFHFYDIDCLDEPVLTKIKDYTDSGLLEITDVGSMPYDVWWKAQGMFMHDCMHRNRFTSKWVMFHDIDEYPQVAAPHTLGSLLRMHEDKPWFSHQAVWWSLHICNNRTEHDLFAVERTVFRWPVEYCQKRGIKDKAMCLSDQGHRKIIVNPRKVELLGIHFVRIPESGGIDFHVHNDMMHHHVQGLNLRGQRYKNRTLCEDIKGDDDHVEWWWRSYDFAKIIPEVRACKFGDRTCEHHYDDGINDNNQ